MVQNRRQNDLEIAVLSSKFDSLSEMVVKHMQSEESERKDIWKELRNLDRKIMYLAMPLLAAAGGGGVLEMLQALS